MRRANIHIIANPASGTGGTGQRLSGLERVLADAGCRVSVRTTECPGDATRLARAVPDDADAIVVAGGDGTVNEVVNGLNGRSRTPLAILATGGANVLARELDLPKDAEGLAAVILGGRTREIDLGVVDSGRNFLAMLSVGFDASVVREVQRTRRGTLGMRGFVMPALRTALAYAAPAISVRIDGGEPVHGALVVVANTATYGGIMRVADRARCDSGRPRWSSCPAGRRPRCRAMPGPP